MYQLCGDIIFFFTGSFDKNLSCLSSFSNHAVSFKYTKKTSKKIIIIFFLKNHPYLYEAFIHSKLICKVNNMRNFFFWAIVAIVF
jgi:hypothetical protein